MAYSDIQDKLGQIKMTNMNQIYSKIPPVKGDLAVRQGDGGSPYTAPPKEKTGPFVPAPKRASTFDEAMGGGGFVGTKRTNVFINEGGEAYILEPNGNFKFDGLYDPVLHGPVFPRVQANDSMKIAKGFVKNVGEPIGIMSATRGLKIIDDSETNPLKKELRRIRMFKNNPIDPGLGGV